MAKALELAQEAYDHGEVPVGAVFLHRGLVIASGRNRTNETKNATRHAEIEAIDLIVSSYENPPWHEIEATAVLIEGNSKVD